jgi:hypothetical protein
MFTVDGSTMFLRSVRLCNINFDRREILNYYHWRCSGRDLLFVSRRRYCAYAASVHQELQVYWRVLKSPTLDLVLSQKNPIVVRVSECYSKVGRGI